MNTFLCQSARLYWAELSCLVLKVQFERFQEVMKVDHELGSICQSVVMVFPRVPGRVCTDRSSEEAKWAALCEFMALFYHVLHNTRISC